jgi:hypothetical protein
MSIREAAEKLLRKLEGNSWLMTVAIGDVDGQGTIYVFLRRPVNSSELDDLKQNGWNGYPVLIERTGSPRPAVHSH